MRVRVVARVASDEQVVYASDLGPGDDVAVDALPIPDDTSHIALLGEAKPCANDSRPSDADRANKLRSGSRSEYGGYVKYPGVPAAGA